MSLVDVIVSGGCVSWFSERAARLWRRLWTRLRPYAWCASEHAAIVTRLLRQGAWLPALARYRMLRDEARRLPTVECLRETQLVLLQQLLLAETSHRDGTLAGERARFDELWADLRAIAGEPQLPARSQHRAVRALTSVLWRLDPHDSERAAEALRLMARLGGHCAECASECRNGLHDFGHLVAQLPGHRELP